MKKIYHISIYMTADESELDHRLAALVEELTELVAKQQTLTLDVEVDSYYESEDEQIDALEREFNLDDDSIYTLKLANQRELS